MIGSASRIGYHEQIKSALLERILEGMLGMLIGATVSLAAYSLAEPLNCLPPPSDCSPVELGLLLLGLSIFVASAVYLAGGVIYCWRRKWRRRRCGERRRG